MPTFVMLCEACDNIFCEPKNVTKPGPSALIVRPSPTINPTPDSPFFRASHHTIPTLKNSASSGCRLCILLWKSVPSEVRQQYESILRTNRHAKWLPCYFTVDRSIFREQHRSSGKIFAEYKYQTASLHPEEHVLPAKRHFQLIGSEELKVNLEENDVASNTRSQKSWNVCKQWLWTCITEHDKCSSPIEALKARLPSRLVEVSQEDFVILRDVCDIKNSEEIEYLALSHCWGQAGTRLMLTSSSATMLYGGVNISALSKTFQDAVMLTKKFWDEFQIRYLWIDSLCIIQDSIADWRSESAIMGLIYQNAFCTLAATSSRDGDGGLFYERDSRHILPCTIPVRPKSGQKKYFHILDQADWSRNVSQGPLNSRAWVFQERLLSNRVLHFTADQLYWECSTSEASESFPNGLPSGFGEQFKQILPFRGNLTIDQPMISRGPYAIWDRIMRTYSSGKLSRRTDRLIALSGIAHKVQRHILPHDTYLAGLWKRDLPFQLLWDVEEGGEPQNDHGQYIAPSWSWASRTGVTPCEKDPWVSAAKTIQIISAGITPVDKDPMGLVSRGCISLSGVLVRGALYRVYTGSTPGISLCINNDTMVHSAICRIDNGLQYTRFLPPVIYCLPVLKGSRNGIPRYRGLLLAPSGYNREFRRYGTFTADSTTSLFSNSCKPSVETGDLNRNGMYEITLV